MRYIELTGSDNRMDCRDGFDDPLNPLPIKCETCGTADYGHSPQPYCLVKSRSMSPQEMAPAENGNFLVRERIRTVLELLTPTECEFFPTRYKGTMEETPWSLAVPTRDVESVKMKPSIPYCESCGFPLPPDQSNSGSWTEPTDLIDDWQPKRDVFKTKQWTYRTLPWPRLCMSVRLYCLLKRLKARGLDECTCEKRVSDSPTVEERAWIEAKLALLDGRGVPMNAPGTVSNEDAKWYRQFLKERAATRISSTDVRAFEKRFKFKLPKTYKDFLAKVGPCSFASVDEQDGYTVHVIAPHEFDCTSFRAGTLQAEDDDTNAVDGVMFARTDFGDCFCFDVRKDRKEYEVFLYLHEYNCFEPYAPDFAACIKRFVSATNDL